MRFTALTACVCLLTATAPSAQTPAPERTRPLKSLDLSLIDTSVDACTNFYQYACGGWRRNNPVPGDKARWGRFDQLRELNLWTLKDILDEASRPVATRTPLQAQVGDFYASCMDQAAIDAAGLQPIASDLSRIAATTSKEDLLRVLGSLRRDGINTLFTLAVGADLKDSTATLMGVDQGGTSLPDRDYYVKDDGKYRETREQYVAHMTRMLALAGADSDVAASNAKAVLALETKLATAQLDRVGRRDPKNRDNKMTAAALTALVPTIDLKTYLAAAEAPAFTEVNVGWPKFFSALNGIWAETSVDDLKTYARWRVLNASAPRLASKFEKENFAFFSTQLRGIKEQPLRWKTCAAAVDNGLGEALGQLYVDKAFGADSKARMTALVDALTVALEQDINQLDWMTQETKVKALEKLRLLNKKKIGYPDAWRDYSGVTVSRTDYLGNNRRADRDDVRRDYEELGKPVDRTRWGMTPPTVNAYYSSQLAEIVFPAGILQPPFFDRSADEAVNFGGIGAVIGHELTHGFDDQGRKFDGKGNLTDWWTEADGKAFEQRASCVADQYSKYSPGKDPKTGEPVFLNGRLTLGENIGDNGGVRIALMALMNTLEGKPRTSVSGYTPEQRFFLGFAQVWCQNVTDAESLQRIVTDSHSAGAFRANGTVSNMPEFAKAFGCKPGSSMVRENRCRVW
ncbi:MAG: M13 family metallopeptidase [Vicinamibacteria bacterium]|nr:M13 family metallopeptidase [Vicinamibacteria bacterium]